MPSRLQQLDPATSDAVGAALRDAFIHSLSASLKLSTAVAAVGVLIALLTLRDARVKARGGVPASVAPVAQRPT